MRNFTFNCKGKLLVINSPVVMGILNVTPDSFYDGGKFGAEKTILFQVEKMLKEGATIIDIGAMSSHPRAEMIAEEEELKRLIPRLKSVCEHFPEAIISVDTFRGKVAEEAIVNGASIINDISAGADERMFSVASIYNCPIIIMHREGNFETMHQKATYGNLLADILDYFNQRIAQAKIAGVRDIIIDPGFGFSKSQEDNYSLLKNMKVLEILDKAILTGISRKSMLCRLLDITTENALNATTAAHMIALQNGASILRVHDVREAMECIAIQAETLK